MAEMVGCRVSADAAALDPLNTGGHQAGKSAQRHDGAGPVKPAPADPQLLDPIGRLAFGAAPKLRIHRPSIMKATGELVEDSLKEL
jgi:hypothetical protein